ncbi:MAG: hypothetical protein QOJ89_4166 [bacterium]|jgi:hypothetical protein
MIATARTSTVVAMLAATLAVAACGGDSNDDAATPAATTAAAAPPATPATTATTATPTATTGDGETAAGVSEAGETLALGTRVVAPYVVYGKAAGAKQETKLGVTVLRVRKGKISDFKGFNLDAKQKATVPYYVEVKYENLGELKLQRFLMDPSIEDSEGQEYKPINLIVLNGTFKPCPNPSHSRLLPGKSFTLCAPVLLPKAKTYERVRFSGDVLQDPYFWK